MKSRVGLIWVGLLGALLAGGVWCSTAALAQTASIANPTPAATSTKAKPKPKAADAMAMADPAPYWWFHGTVDVGGRFFVNNAQNHHQTATGPSTGCGAGGVSPCPGVAGKSLAGYYEYTDVAPGAFGDFDIAMGSKDGLYEIDLGGHNIGYDDQSYYFDFSEAGKQYFTFDWDQTPHVYSESALTPYVVSGNAVTLSASCAGAATVATLASCAHPADIGIRRDTAHVHYRWTPDDAWDINVDYSHMDRYGTQPGASESIGTPATTQLPKPVNDTTQNYALNGEYAGISPWGKRIVFKAGYKGSTYTDDFNYYSIADPSGGAGGVISTWPSNQANGFVASMAADLPWQSRYVGTLDYTMMRQNDSFPPNNSGTTYTGLNGAINTLMSNNVLTTKINSDLTSKLTYRYYDFDNQTPELFFSNVGVRPPGGGSVTTNSISMGYTKQNAGAALNWRPSREWNLGAAYGFERYDWTRADVNVTNQNSGKLFADWQPNSWFGLRTSGYYSNRRYDNYDYLAYVGNFQWPSGGNELYQQTYRQLMIDNRQVWKANISANIVVIDGLTLSPTFKYEDDSYGVDPTTQQGLKDAKKWSAGIDATYLINPATSITVGYMYQHGSQLLYGICNTTGGFGQCNGGAQPTTNSQTVTTDKTDVHSFTALLRYAVIPDKLDTSLRYTASYGIDNMKLYTEIGAPTDGQFPNNKTWFQRLDATATYTFDKDQLKQLGWKGTVKAKLHYVWERNSETNWGNDPLTPYSTDAALQGQLWLGWYNPNYNVQMIMASLSFGW